jgi:hypothetical protein
MALKEVCRKERLTQIEWVEKHVKTDLAKAAATTPDTKDKAAG